MPRKASSLADKIIEKVVREQEPRCCVAGRLCVRVARSPRRDPRGFVPAFVAKLGRPNESMLFCFGFGASIEAAVSALEAHAAEFLVAPSDRQDLRIAFAAAVKGSG